MMMMMMEIKMMMTIDFALISSFTLDYIFCTFIFDSALYIWTSSVSMFALASGLFFSLTLDSAPILLLLYRLHLHYNGCVHKHPSSKHTPSSFILSNPSMFLSENLNWKWLCEIKIPLCAAGGLQTPLHQSASLHDGITMSQTANTALAARRWRFHSLLSPVCECGGSTRGNHAYVCVFSFHWCLSW